jgi:hypothetical protein
MPGDFQGLIFKQCLSGEDSIPLNSVENEQRNAPGHTKGSQTMIRLEFPEHLTNLKWNMGPELALDSELGFLADSPEYVICRILVVLGHSQRIQNIGSSFLWKLSDSGFPQNYLRSLIGQLYALRTDVPRSWGESRYDCIVIQARWLFLFPL